MTVAAERRCNQMDDSFERRVVSKVIKGLESLDKLGVDLVLSISHYSSFFFLKDKV